jgi:hypothetical protein
VSEIRLSSRPVSGPLGWSSRAPGGRPSAVHPCGVQPSGVGPRPSGRVRLLPAQAVALGTQVEKAGTRATLPKSRWSVGGRWRTRAAGLGAGRGDHACPLSDQAGRAGGRSARRGRLRGGHGSRLQRGDGSRRAAGVLGWVRDHGGWSSPRLTPGRGGPGGARGGAGGDGRAAPARPKPAANAPGSLPAAL